MEHILRHLFSVLVIAWLLSTPIVSKGNSLIHERAKSENNNPSTGVEFGNCNSGVSPGEVPICTGDSPFCLIDLLEALPDPNGSWTGPLGWTGDASDCGYFDPASHPPGEYTYSVVGLNDETCTSTINMINTDLGTISSIIYCEPEPYNLFESINTPNGLPLNGNWYYPNTYPEPSGIVPDGIIVPNLDPTGSYLYTFLDSENCFTRATANMRYSTAGAGGIETWADICDNTSAIYLFDLLEGDPYPGGSWIQYASDGTFLDYYSTYDINLHISNLHNGDLLTYIIGAPPCSPEFIDLHINVFPGLSSENNASVVACLYTGEILLNSLLNGYIESGGQWLNPAGEEIDNVINSEIAQPGIYTYTISDGICDGTAYLDLSFTTLPFADQEVEYVYCGESIEGTTIGSSTTDIPGFCGTAPGSGGGVWYAITGNGQEITADLCQSNFDTKLNIYQGECGSLECVTGIDDFCGEQSQVTWASIEGIEYLIYVNGFAAQTGDFILNINCENVSGPSIAGEVAWDANCAGRSVDVHFYHVGTNMLSNTYSAIVDLEGDFTIYGVDEGNFDIIVKVEGYLAVGFPDIEIGDGMHELDSGKILTGDVNSDNAINIVDVSALNSAFGSVIGDPSYNHLADLNCDGFVNIVDVSILNAGFGFTGAIPPLN